MGQAHGLLGEDPLSQGLQALFPGHRRPGAPLGPVGEIDVFQDREALGCKYLLLQFISQLPGAFEGLEDALPPLVQFPKGL
jgi:hypothetical protein